MSRAYIRLDPAFFERKMLDQHYSPGEGIALVGAFCLSEQQIPRGHFRNERLLRALLGPFGRYVPALLLRGDLTVDDAGRIYVDGWDEWQEGDVTVKDRMVRLRARRNRSDAMDRNPTVPSRTARVGKTPRGGAEKRSGAEQKGL